MSAISAIARVAFNINVRSLFDYRVDNASDVLGRRVLAPFQSGKKVGLVLEIAETTCVCPTKLKAIACVFDDMPPLPEKTLQLIRFCSSYYHCPVGMAAAAFLPAPFRRSRPYSLPSGYRLTGEDVFAVSGNQARYMLRLLAAQGVMSLPQIRQHIRAPWAILTRLQKQGYVTRCVLWPDNPPVTPVIPPTLTACQQAAVRALHVGEGFVPHLLFAPTGSGKTEIYMHAVDRVLSNHRQVLILIPEIDLTSHMEKIVRQRFPDKRLCVLHSRLTDSERACRWLMACTGAADIVLGTRLSVFTPLPALGLIIVDEEHDESYRQTQSGFLFCARNVAVWRARNENIPFLAGSATPSLESYRHTLSGNWRLVSLRQRVISPRLTYDVLHTKGRLYHGMETYFCAVWRRLCSAVNKH